MEFRFLRGGPGAFGVGEQSVVGTAVDADFVGLGFKCHGPEDRYVVDGDRISRRRRLGAENDSHWGSFGSLDVYRASGANLDVMALFAKAVGWAREWTSLGLDLVFPPAVLPGAKPAPIQEPFCQQCGEPFAGDFSRNFRCTNCEDREWSLAWARAAYPAEGAVRQVVHAFKYRGDFF